jgi:mycofactocin precursor
MFAEPTGRARPMAPTEQSKAALTDAQEPVVEEALLEEALLEEALVEEVSIDGMCGVY